MVLAYHTYCNLGARKINSNVVRRLNNSFRNSPRLRLVLINIWVFYMHYM